MNTERQMMEYNEIIDTVDCGLSISVAHPLSIYFVVIILHFQTSFTWGSKNFLQYMWVAPILQLEKQLQCSFKPVFLKSAYQF